MKKDRNKKELREMEKEFETIREMHHRYFYVTLYLRLHPIRNVNAGSHHREQISPCRRRSIAGYVTEPKGDRCP